MNAKILQGWWHGLVKPALWASKIFTLHGIWVATICGNSRNNVPDTMLDMLQIEKSTPSQLKRPNKALLGVMHAWRYHATVQISVRSSSVINITAAKVRHRWIYAQERDSGVHCRRGFPQVHCDLIRCLIQIIVYGLITE